MNALSQNRFRGGLPPAQPSGFAARLRVRLPNGKRVPWPRGEAAGLGGGASPPPARVFVYEGVYFWLTGSLTGLTVKLDSRLTSGVKLSIPESISFQFLTFEFQFNLIWS